VAERTPEPTAEPTPGPTPTTSTYAVGDVITIPQNNEPWADFVVLEVREAEMFPAPNGQYADSPQISGYIFLAARVRYEALTDGVRYGSFQFDLLVDGQAVDSYPFAPNGPKPELSRGTLSQGLTTEGWVLYEVPPVGEVRLSYSDLLTLNEPPIFEVVLRSMSGT
jgi:hypothetical protein